MRNLVVVTLPEACYGDTARIAHQLDPKNETFSTRTLQVDHQATVRVLEVCLG
jgi:hypothetical protein